MATFRVDMARIAEMKKHPNADRLDLAKVEGLGFQFCVGRDEYKVGDTVVYFPIDAVLPDQIADGLNIRNHLAGTKKNRVKTVFLREQSGQGVVCKPSAVFPEGTEVPPVGTDVAALLGVTKYEPPEVFVAGARLLPLPEGLGFYDIEGAERYQPVVDLLMDSLVYISEKLEGSNSSTVKNPENGTVNVCQHGYLIAVDEGATNTYMEAAKWGGFPEILDSIKPEVPMMIALRGELLGPNIQGNIYKLAKHEIRLFDVKVGGRYMGPEEFEATVPDPGKRVPVIAKNVILREWLAERTLQEASNGMSLLNPQVRREGIVIRPMVEQYVDFGDGSRQRLIIKQRSPVYLAKEKD